MKHYFKHSSGYVNIDEKNLYLTNSGNWQEARELKEKSSLTIKKNNVRISNINGFLYTLFAIFAFLVYLMVDSKKISITFIALLAVAGYYVLQYFKSDFGHCYKIPLYKIESIDKLNKGVKISFRNEADEPDVETIDNIEPRGFEVLSSLNLITA